MNVCAICGGDGVLQVLYHWYCINHLENGLLTVVRYVAQMRGWDVQEATEQISAWLAS